ncbi:MAG TPA: cupin domain-containing protein [Candidatus Acidoferrales bacterium]|nr:cupin domain-containing protein [Candidatus Acidoferrales bacterium]
MAKNAKDLETIEGRGGLAPARKQNLASLVSYQSGSVVSRTIISRRAGTMTLFAFDEGETLSEHTAPYDALLHVLEGEARVLVSGDENQVREGEAIVLPAGKPHAVKATKKFKMLLTMIRA